VIGGGGPGAPGRGVILVLLAGVVASGCRMISQLGGPRWEGTVDTVGGVTVVRSPATPVLDSGAIRLAPVWRDSLPDSLLEGPVWNPDPSLAVDESRLYLLDRRGGRVDVFDAGDGATRGGWPTSAPGGRDSLVTLLALPGRVVVGSHQELAVYPSDGHEVHRIRLDADGRSLFPLDDTTVLSLEAGGGGVAWRRYVVTDTIGHPFLPGDVHSRIAPEVMDFDCWKMDGGGGRLLVLACTRPVVMAVGDTGAMLSEFGIQRAADTASAAELDTLRRLYRARAAEMDSKLEGSVLDAMVEREVRLQRVEHVYRGVRFDSASGLYALLRQTPAFLGGSGTARLDLLTRAGLYLATVDVPGRIVAYDLAGGNLYALLAPGGATPPILAAFRVEIPSDVRERAAWWRDPEKKEGGR